MNHAFSIYDFSDQSTEARELQKVLEKIAAARQKTTTAKLFADPAREGWSWKNLYALSRKWIESGRNPLVLIDRRYHADLQKRKEDIGLPREFIDWASGLMLGNQRKSRQAVRDIILQWRAWRATGDSKYRIPGYDQPPAPGPKNHPVGWSYDNLIKCAQPDEAERAIARIGTVAAKQFLPFIPGTREGARFLEFVFFDDVVHDREGVLPGYIDPMRILQLGGLCYATEVYLKFGIRPDLPRDDGTRERLKRREFLMLVATLLMDYGHPAEYPMHLIVERGTATMSQAEAQYLYDISDGMIRVCYTSMEGQLVLAWQEGKSGNSAGKACLESWHNLFHNYMAGLSGQVGKDRDHAPAALYGARREVAALNKASLLLSREQRVALKLPYSSINEAHGETLDAVHRINRRRDHELEGFGKVMLWRLKGVQMDWQPEAAILNLDPALRANVEFLPVMENPIERMQRLSMGVSLVKPHPGALIRLYEDNHTAAKIERRQASAKITGKTFWFGPEDPMDALAEGTEVTLHHAPLDPEYALVTSGGRFVGVWKRQLIKRGDADALAKGISRKQSFLNHAMSTVRGKMLDALVEQDRRITGNIEVLTDAGVLPSESQYALSTTVEKKTGIAEAMQAAESARKRATRDDTDLAKRAAAALADRNLIPDYDYADPDTTTDDDGRY